MDLSIFGTDKDLETSGVWHDVGDSRLCIARTGNPEYLKMIRRLLKPSEALINSGTQQADDLVERATMQAMAETILVDWANVTDEDVLLPYSTKNATLMFTKYPDFRELVASLAQQAEHYRTHTRGEQLKN